MYLTDMEFLNAKISAIGKLNESDIVKYILQEDIESPQKIAMYQGERYYNAEHDSLQKEYNKAEILESDTVDGYEKEVKRTLKNPNRSNHHNVDAFHKLLVEQKVSFLVGKEPTISVAGAEKNQELKKYETIISDKADEEFNELLQDWVCGASNKGFEALHFYYDTKGNLQHCIIPATEIIPIYDTAYQKDLTEVIRYYTIKVIKNGQEFLQRKVEWWTKDQVTYYVEKEKDLFVLDTDYPVNPAPHWWGINLVNGIEKRREPHCWGKVPFVLLENNRYRTTDLQPIKGLIDAYDMISSEGTNNFLDLVDLYWVIQGYGGETTGAIMRMLQVNKAVNVLDPNGKVEARQVTLPVNERIEFLKTLRRDIYHFGMGIDIDDERFGTAPSGIALQFRYANLKHKCENMAPKLKKSIKEFFYFFTEDYNRKNGTAYDASLIHITLNYSMIANDLETVQMIAQSKGVVSDKTLLARHPFVADVNEELKELAIEDQAARERYDTYESYPQRVGEEDEKR